jgi:hypothetical protein
MNAFKLDENAIETWRIVVPIDHVNELVTALEQNRKISERINEPGSNSNNDIVTSTFWRANR